MARLLRLFTYNWPLKLGAIAASVILYTGLVVAQNERVFAGPVRAQAVNQSTEGELLDPLPNVTSIRYIAPVDIAARVDAGDFRATVDLSGVRPSPGGAPISVSVQVEALDPRVQVRSWEPQFASVRLDPVITRVVPVRAVPGTAPAGLVPGRPTTSPAHVEVTGPGSVVNRVREAVAQVRIEPTATLIDNDFELLPVDAAGRVVTQARLEPNVARVTMEVDRLETTRVVPVEVRLVGTVATGYELATVHVSPLTVTVQGDQVAINRLRSIQTIPLDITDRTADVSATLELTVPPGLALLEATSVRVTVDIVPRSGSRSYSLGLTLEGAASQLEYELLVPQVVVTLAGPVATLAGVDPLALVGRVDVSTLGPGTHLVPVALTAPDGTSQVAIAPASVEVRISARPTPTPVPTTPPSAPPTAAPSPTAGSSVTPTAPPGGGSAGEGRPGG